MPDNVNWDVVWQSLVDTWLPVVGIVVVGVVVVGVVIAIIAIVIHKKKK